ncbi:unnamed protein product [Phaeothamnion confervicola]
MQFLSGKRLPVTNVVLVLSGLVARKVIKSCLGPSGTFVLAGLILILWRKLKQRTEDTAEHAENLRNMGVRLGRELRETRCRSLSSFGGFGSSGAGTVPYHGSSLGSCAFSRVGRRRRHGSAEPSGAGSYRTRLDLPPPDAALDDDDNLLAWLPPPPDVFCASPLGVSGPAVCGGSEPTPTASPPGSEHNANPFGMHASRRKGSGDGLRRRGKNCGAAATADGAALVAGGADAALAAAAVGVAAGVAEGPLEEGDGRRPAHQQ